ncbi:MAG: PC4/YdbC family ssDNA-binding protein [Elusimicrobia bacterium]|nr:PC4/YdbC family ssDNA-binding protein [Elusimicrobiota bacterium]
MAEAKEFKPLKELGAVALSETSELKFYVDEYKGHRYGSIRTFVKGDAYSGPTKAGVTLNARVLDETLPVLEKLPAEPDAAEDRELVRIPKKLGAELVIRITLYKGTVGIDLREWVDEAEFKGWSKKGVRVPYKDLAAMVGYLRQMKALVAKP